MSARSIAAPSAPRVRLRLPRRDARTALLYIAPAFIVMGIITFYPLLFQTWMSFTDFQLINLSGKVPPNGVGLDNYIRILQSKLDIPNFEFVRLLFFNLFWAFSNVIIHVILGVAIAILLNNPGLRLKKVYRALFVLPVVIPPTRGGDGLAPHLRQGRRRRERAPGRGRDPAPPAARCPEARLAGPGERPDPVHPVAPGVLRPAHREHVARLAAQLGGRDRGPPEHPA